MKAIKKYLTYGALALLALLILGALAPDTSKCGADDGTAGWAQTCGDGYEYRR